VTLTYRAYNAAGYLVSSGAFAPQVTRVLVDGQQIAPAPANPPEPASPRPWSRQTREEADLYSGAVLSALARLDAQTGLPPGTAAIERGWVMRRAPSSLPKEARRGAYGRLAHALDVLASTRDSGVVPTAGKPDDPEPRAYHYRPAGWQGPPATQPTIPPA